YGNVGEFAQSGYHVVGNAHDTRIHGTWFSSGNFFSAPHSKPFVDGAPHDPANVYLYNNLNSDAPQGGDAAVAKYLPVGDTSSRDSDDTEPDKYCARD